MVSLKRNLIYCLICTIFFVLVASDDRVDQLESLVQLQGEEIAKLKQQCNLAAVKQGIRQNGIALAKVRHLVVFNDNRISGNLNKINEIKADIADVADIVNTKVLRTCYELQQNGMEKNGKYLIDPDGPMIGQDPIEVYCDFENGLTEVLHDMHQQMIEVEECDADPGCAVYNLTYDVPKEQIEALIQLSDSCTQDIQFGCFLAPLSGNGSDFGFWTDKNYNKQTFFNGNQSCSDPDFDCNCDSQEPEWKMDEGTISAKDILPITSFAYGPLINGMEGQANFSIGQLKCFGSVEIDPNSVTCNSLKMDGSFKSGIYNLKEPNQSPRLGHCQMDQDGYEEDMETPLGFFDTFDDPEVISFAANKRFGQPITADQIVTFDTILYNHGNGLDKQTGEFTVPKSGTYNFNFAATIGGGPKTKMLVLKNEVEILKFQVQGHWISHTWTWTMDLEVNDVLKLRVAEGKLFPTHLQWLQFNGQLIRDPA